MVNPLRASGDHASVLLDVRRLSVDYKGPSRIVHAVDELGFSIGRGEAVAIVGESGSGKSTAALALLRLLPRPAARIVQGEVEFAGKDLVRLSDDELQNVRGGEISMVFQDPLAALNPIQSIGRQMIEMLLRHRSDSAAEARRQAIEMLTLVGMPSPERVLRQYPHQLSGGMRQRVMIGIALICRPQLLIADEPTSALDVTVQAQVLDLLGMLSRRLGMALLLITHDLGVVAQIAHRVVVIHAGRKVEEGSVRDVFARPLHPYTVALLDAARLRLSEDGYLAELSESSGPASSSTRGCSFAGRCPRKIARCDHEMPMLDELAPGRLIRCFVAQGKLH